MEICNYLFLFQAEEVEHTDEPHANGKANGKINGESKR